MTMEQLTEQEGQLLIRFARLTLEEKFQLSSGIDRQLAAELDREIFRRKVGIFVTLTRDGALRGCIGNLSASVSLLEGVRCNALYAAFQDHRFRPLAVEELPLVRIELSILTESVPLAYDDPQQLVSKLRPHVDGVILRKGGCSATFLPQVWEQLPDPSIFLSQLCCKAHLPPDAWRCEHPEISTYQVQKFREKV